MPEVTDKFVRIPVKTPASDAQIRTMSLDEAKGIWALYDKANGEIVTYLFRIDKGWDMAKSRVWVDKHRSGQKSKRVEARRVGWDGSDRLQVVMGANGIELHEDEEAEKYEGEHLTPVQFVAAEKLAFDVDYMERDEEGVPTAFRILAFGKWDIPKYGGDLVVDKATAEGTLGYHAWRGMKELLIDRDHLSKLPINMGGSTKAKGWWVPEVRSDGIWAADLQWPPKTYEELKDGEWKHFSPTGKFNAKTKHVDFIDSIALTNDPATLSQAPIIIATLGDETIDDGGNSAPAIAQPAPPEVDNEGDMLMATIRELLGLKPEATDEEVLGAVKAVQAKATETDGKDKEITDLKASMGKDEDEVKSLKAFQATTLEACKLEASATDKDVLAYVSTLQAKEPQAAKAADLEAKVAKLEKGQEESRVKDLVASVGDYVTPENKERVEKLARTLDADLFVATVQGFPKIKGDGVVPISDTKEKERNVNDEEFLGKADLDLIAAKRKDGEEGWEKDGEQYKAYVAVRREEENELS